jgi:Bifunctional DNA primase/polymerase, N-terminal
VSGLGAFNEFAERLAENGFTVIPARGKVPAVPRWQNPSPTDVQWLSKMVGRDRYPGHNLGIVCGRVIGIDIDAEDPLKVAKLKALAAQHFGETPFERVGRAPRTLLLYRPAVGEAIPSLAKVGGCIDVLSGGKQFIAFGIHPETGNSYQWIAVSPATANLNAVPTVTAASIRKFADAVCRATESPMIGLPQFSVHRMDTDRRSHHWTRQAEFSGSGNPPIVLDAYGRVVDGREAFLAKLTAAEFAKRTHRTPDELGNIVWARFIAGSDLTRPKGSNPKRRWSLKDALAKARATCRRNPNLKRPRRSRGGHPASHLHAWRKPGFWTAEQQEMHLTEVHRRITTPATLAVAWVMIEAVELPSGLCTISIAEIAKRAHCSPKTAKVARAALRDAGLWISGPNGVFVPVAGLNRAQAPETKPRKQREGTIKGPPLYHLVVSTSSAPANGPFEHGAVTPLHKQAQRLGSATIPSSSPDCMGGSRVEAIE